MCKFQYQNEEKQKNGKIFPKLYKGVIRGLQIEPGLRNYKSGPEELQIRVALGISSRGKKITNRSKEILNRGRD